MAGRAARRRGEDAGDTAVIRCDPLLHFMNPGKERLVLAFLAGWRRCAADVARIQWRGFLATGRFAPLADAAKEFRKDYARPRARILEALVAHHGLDRPPPLAEGEKPCKRFLDTPAGLVDPLAVHKAEIGAAPVAMVRRQVVGMLEGFVSNRQNDFVDIVLGSTVDPETRHMLLAVNKARAWQTLDRPITIKRHDGVRVVVPPAFRQLARAIWRQVMSRHGRPSTNRISMSIDKRNATLPPPAIALSSVIGVGCPSHTMVASRFP